MLRVSIATKLAVFLSPTNHTIKLAFDTTPNKELLLKLYRRLKPGFNLAAKEKDCVLAKMS